MTTLVNADVAYIHIPKCAGHSVEDYLKRTLPSAMGTSFRHVSVNHLKQSGFDVEELPLILGVIRNPLSRELSQWNFWREEYANGKRGKEIENAKEHEFREWVKTPLANFACGDQYGKGIYHWWLNLNGKIPNNLKVIRLEDLETELPKVTAPYRFLRADIPKLNQSDHKDFMSYYDEETIAYVESKYQWTIQKGYYKSSLPSRGNRDQSFRKSTNSTGDDKKG